MHGCQRKGQPNIRVTYRGCQNQEDAEVELSV